jgi:hypothetical protein
MFELHDFISVFRKSWDSAVGIAIGYGLRAGRLGFDSRQNQDIFSQLQSVQTDSGAQSTYSPVGTGGRGVKPATHLHLVPRSRMVEVCMCKGWA